MVPRPKRTWKKKGVRMKKRFKKEVEKKLVFGEETFVFHIDEKNIALFESAKEQSEDVYFLIENLEFLRIDYLFGKRGE